MEALAPAVAACASAAGLVTATNHASFTNLEDFWKAHDAACKQIGFEVSKLGMALSSPPIVLEAIKPTSEALSNALLLFASNVSTLGPAHGRELHALVRRHAKELVEALTALLAEIVRKDRPGFDSVLAACGPVFHLCDAAPSLPRNAGQAAGVQLQPLLLLVADCLQELEEAIAGAGTGAGEGGEAEDDDKDEDEEEEEEETWTARQRTVLPYASALLKATLKLIDKTIQSVKEAPTSTPDEISAIDSCYEACESLSEKCDDVAAALYPPMNEAELAEALPLLKQQDEAVLAACARLPAGGAAWTRALGNAVVHNVDKLMAGLSLEGGEATEGKEENVK